MLPHAVRDPRKPSFALAAGLALACLSACAAPVPSPAPAPDPGSPVAALDSAALAQEPSVRALADTALSERRAGGPAIDSAAAAVLGSVGERTPADAASAATGALADPAGVAAAGRSWAARTLARMTLRQKVGQLLMPFVLGDFAPEGSASHDRIVDMVREEAIGGVIVSVGTPAGVAVKLNDLQEHAEVPLLVAADLETGAGFRLRGAVHVPSEIELGGATDFPSLMAVGATGDPALAYAMGRVTAVEARAVGIHVAFAPVLDVNSNPENPIINVRSFGEDPGRVASLGAAFVRGVEEAGALATGKHFPGHGDTDIDSHLDLPIIRASWERLDSVELVPFRGAIAAGMSGVMTAHIAVPALNGGRAVPSTLSHEVLTDLLRERMGFEGLVFTDALDMGAIDRRFDRGEAAVRAVEAGADVLLMPPSVEEALEAVVRAVRSGRVSEARIDSSALRILGVKERIGLDDRRTVDLDAMLNHVGIPEHERVAREVAERSITLLRNGRGLLPLLGTRSARVLAVTYRPSDDILAGKYFQAMLRDTYPRLRATDVERDTRGDEWDRLLRRARRSPLVVVSLYVTAVSYRGSVAVPEDVSEFVRALDGIGVPHVVISFGNPYLMSEFPDVQAYMLAWSSSEASQRAAARALFGEIPITGRTPTRLPPFFEIGDGIQLPARTRVDGN